KFTHEGWHVRSPQLLLQPLVENAVKHGIAPTRGGGTVTVRAWRDTGSDDEFLRFLVIDTGIGSATSDVMKHDGVGLANVESRLRHYYGAEAAITIRPTPGGGTTVEVCIPWMGAESPAVAT